MLLQQERLAGASLLVFCNKQDLQGALTLDAIKDFLKLDELTTRHWAVVACSAMTGKGLLAGIDWIVQDIAARIFMMD
jgi:ADP-ribosylation factor-like protein 2